MSQTRRRPPPSEEDDEWMSDRYIVVPAVLWTAAILAALLATPLRPDAPGQARADAAPAEAATASYGA